MTSEGSSRASQSTHWHRRLVISLLALVLAGVFGVDRAWALGDKPRAGETVTQYLTPVILQELFPGAERIGEVSGAPPAATVYKGDRPIGYIFSTWDVTQSRGFADRPLVLLVGLALSGRITGVKLVHHAEAIGILGLRDEDFLHFPDQFTGYNISNHLQVVARTGLAAGSPRQPFATSNARTSASEGGCDRACDHELDFHGRRDCPRGTYRGTQPRAFCRPPTGA